MIPAGKLEQIGAEDGPGFQIEGSLSRVERHSSGRGLLLFRRQPAQIDDGNLYPEFRRDDLNWMEILDPKAGAQHCMAADDLVQGKLEGVELQRALHPDYKWRVVIRMVRLQLIEEP